MPTGLIGRKLIRNFGPSHVCIEIYPVALSPYKLNEQETLIYDIMEWLGEKTETLVGVSLENGWGRDMNSCMPGNHPMMWITEAEYEKMKAEGTLESTIHPAKKV